MFWLKTLKEIFCVSWLSVQLEDSHHIHAEPSQRTFKLILPHVSCISFSDRTILTLNSINSHRLFLSDTVKGLIANEGLAWPFKE